MRGARAGGACDIMAADYAEAARGEPRLSRRQWFWRLEHVSQSKVRDAIEAFARGEIVVVTDDDDRENEGDLILAAAHTTPEKMAFIVRHTCGIVCAPVTGEIARRLHLAPMVADSDAIHGTAFTISVDYRHGTTTGISADDRTATIRALANNNTGRADFVRPGHIFPLIAKDGGVLMRSGHTEAAIDLCRIAAIEPVAAICELVNDDGTVMRGPQIAAFAKKHTLKRISVADLIAYRQAREKLVTRVAEFKIETEIGEFTGYAYVTPFDKVHHYAFVYGKIGDGRNVPTRLHRANVVEDVFGGAQTIHAALGRFKKSGRGVLVYLRRRAADRRRARRARCLDCPLRSGVRLVARHDLLRDRRQSVAVRRGRSVCRGDHGPLRRAAHDEPGHGRDGLRCRSDTDDAPIVAASAAVGRRRGSRDRFSRLVSIGLYRSPLVPRPPGPRNGRIDGIECGRPAGFSADDGVADRECRLADHVPRIDRDRHRVRAGPAVADA